MLLQTFIRRVLTARHTEMLLMITLDVLVPRIAAEAKAYKLSYVSSVMPYTTDTSRGRSFASHGPLGCFAVTLVVCPARNGGRWLDMVVSDTLAGHMGATRAMLDLEQIMCALEVATALMCALEVLQSKVANKVLQ